MKDYIEWHYRLEELPLYDNLRKYINEAWDAVTEDRLQKLLATMPVRC